GERLPAATRSRVRPPGRRAAPVVRRLGGGVRALPARARRPAQLTVLRGVAVGACALAVLALVPIPARADAPRCNGEPQLCARTLGEVAFATTHNAMASTAKGFVPPNQRRSMRAQLEHGIRAFQID